MHDMPRLYIVSGSNYFKIWRPPGFLGAFGWPLSTNFNLSVYIDFSVVFWIYMLSLTLGRCIDIDFTFEKATGLLWLRLARQPRQGTVDEPLTSLMNGVADEISDGILLKSSRLDLLSLQTIFQTRPTGKENI